MFTHAGQRPLAAGAQEHGDSAWLSGTIPGDVLPPKAHPHWRLTGWGHWHRVPRQAEMRLLDLLPAQLPHEELVFVPHVSLQAILVLDSPDVDLRLWNATVGEMEASGTLERAPRLFSNGGARARMVIGSGLADELFTLDRRAWKNVNINVSLATEPSGPISHLCVTGTARARSPAGMSVVPACPVV